MIELTEEEKEVAQKMNISPEAYAGAKREVETLSPEALAVGAHEVAKKLGVSLDDWQKHGVIVIEESEDNESGTS